ncbi:hypothetical protein H5410_030571 [Solanum commersonii]|uniref:Uncharacterized protein n=1 Tax=Solanum commersonii TaxID=4109 RepID=A0A9J5YG27_SOLCO|nr:hypothetical protein H5410_030571 [Solanum commersonii]
MDYIIQGRSEELQRFSGAGYSPHEKVYNFSKIIIKQVILVEDRAFDKVLYYNNDKHKHIWFIKVCTKIFAEPIPNWFINWLSYHGPIIQILPEQFLKLYKEWTKVSPDLNKLYHELLDTISERITEYNEIPQKGIIDDNSVRHIARRISFQEGAKESMINDYLEEVKRNLLQTITQIDKSDTSMRSETSNDDIAGESQQVETNNILSATELQDAEEFLQQMKAMDKRHGKEKT